MSFISNILDMFFIPVCWLYMLNMCHQWIIILLFMQWGFIRVKTIRSCVRSTGLSAAVTDLNAVVGSLALTAQHVNITLSAVAPSYSFPFSNTSNYAIYSLPGSTSNHDSLLIRSHLNCMLWEASGLVERVSLSLENTHTDTHGVYKWFSKDWEILA